MNICSDLSRSQVIVNSDHTVREIKSVKGIKAIVCVCSTPNLRVIVPACV
jgi:hypothetical protein